MHLTTPIASMFVFVSSSMRRAYYCLLRNERWPPSFRSHWWSPVRSSSTPTKSRALSVHTASPTWFLSALLLPVSFSAKAHTLPVISMSPPNSAFSMVFTSSSVSFGAGYLARDLHSRCLLPMSRLPSTGARFCCECWTLRPLNLFASSGRFALSSLVPNLSIIEIIWLCSIVQKYILETSHSQIVHGTWKWIGKQYPTGCLESATKQEFPA